MSTDVSNADYYLRVKEALLDKEVVTARYEEPEVDPLQEEMLEWYQDEQVNPHLNGEKPW